jgi:hypothetical protein
VASSLHQAVVPWQVYAIAGSGCVKGPPPGGPLIRSSRRC